MIDINKVVSSAGDLLEKGQADASVYEAILSQITESVVLLKSLEYRILEAHSETQTLHAGDRVYVTVFNTLKNEEEKIDCFIKEVLMPIGSVAYRFNKTKADGTMSTVNHNISQRIVRVEKYPVVLKYEYPIVFEKVYQIKGFRKIPYFKGKRNGVTYKIVTNGIGTAYFVHVKGKNLDFHSAKFNTHEESLHFCETFDIEKHKKIVSAKNKTITVFCKENNHRGEVVSKAEYLRRIKG